MEKLKNNTVSCTFYIGRYYIFFSLILGQIISDKERKDLLLLLFPLICSHRGNVINQANKRRLSKAFYEEIRSAFARFVPREADIQETLALLRETAVKYGKTIQPIVIYTGTETNVQSDWLVIDQILYKFSSLCKAVDCTVKVYFALDACNPPPAKTVWGGGVLSKVLFNLGELIGSASQFVIEFQTRLPKVVSETHTSATPSNSTSPVLPHNFMGGDSCREYVNW